jgi:hypothetical protein
VKSLLQRLLLALRVRRQFRLQRKQDQAWLATGPDPSEVLRLRNDRRTEWMRWQADHADPMFRVDEDES